MPDLQTRGLYAGVALKNIGISSVALMPDVSLEIGSDGFIGPVHQGRIIPVNMLNDEQILPYNRLQSENKNKTDKAILFDQFAYQDYLGQAVS
jgi:hypothetical protein